MVTRKRLTIKGLVQGVGFRPFLWRMAVRHRLSGWVENDQGGVTVEVEGPCDAVSAFIAAIPSEAPPSARVASITQNDRPLDENDVGFVILESLTKSAAPRFETAADAPVPPDVVTCEACLSEIRDPLGRRSRHPFATCTDCGPRFTIITSLPYDRPRTTMANFPMCDQCHWEYHDPSNRRFHAQAIACPNCGPIVWFTTADDPGGIRTTRPSSLEADGLPTGEVAILAAKARITSGGIVAVKGIGGFHLVCDATNHDAVNMLRRRKVRGEKPLAVMAGDLEAAARLATMSPQEARLLADPAGPIVLLARHEHCRLADGVAPGNDFVGVMLPPSPLHHLLAEAMPPLVVTSGNRADEPISHDNTEASVRLAGLVDAFLMHDRRIRVPCDDSVVRCVAGLSMPIRRSRGHVPLPIALADDGPTVLAIGGEVKATVCLAAGRHALMSQHIGDLVNLETLESLAEAVSQLERLLGHRPERIVADLHPGYLSTQWAREQAMARGIPLVQVQHHEAHVASLLVEHGMPLSSSRPVITVCFDGTGYGRDGTIQGGEAIAVVEGRFHRVGHLAPFLLPGADAAIRQPWRTALAVLHAAGLGDAPRLPNDTGAEFVRRQLATGFHCISTTSMGRLFDAVASLTGTCHEIGYEAEAAMRLEAAANIGRASDDSRPHYAFETTSGGHSGPIVIDWRPLVRAVIDDTRAGMPTTAIALGFHDAVAAMIAAVANAVRRRMNTCLVGLTGGVFQNRLLTELAIERLSGEGFEVLVHSQVPPNDGGLSLGQAVLGRSQRT